MKKLTFAQFLDIILKLFLTIIDNMHVIEVHLNFFRILGHALHHFRQIFNCCLK